MKITEWIKKNWIGGAIGGGAAYLLMQDISSTHGTGLWGITHAIGWVCIPGIYIAGIITGKGFLSNNLEPWSTVINVVIYAILGMWIYSKVKKR